MEEADVLGDLVGIMSAGELKCLGTPLHLKNQYGAGYRINLTARDESCIDIVKQFIANDLQGAEVLAATGVSFVLSFPSARFENLIPVFANLEKQKSNPDFFIKEFGISQTSNYFFLLLCISF